MINTLLLSCFIITGLVDAVPVSKNDGHIQMTIKREVSSGISSLMSSLAENPGTTNISLFDNHYIYRASCSIGSPGQPQELIVDTGSPEIWVYSPSVGDAYSSFDTSASSTLKYVDDTLVLHYVDGSSYDGYHYSDDFSFSGITINNQEFGYVDDSNAKNGTAIWGLSPWLQNKKSTYPTMMNNLKSQGFVSKEAYSMSLDDNEGQEGSILFGALDRSKYVGDLWSQKISLPDRYAINLTGITNVEGDEVPFSGPQPALLDSGTTSMIIPDEALAEITKGFNVTLIPFLGIYFWNEKPNSGEVSFSFGGAEIKVPATSFYDEENTFFGLHVFGALPYSLYNLNLTILGDVFLRSAYVVYNSDDWEIAIAQSSDGSGAEDIVVFDDTPGIPGSKSL